jgi:hypothetical protein
MAGSAPMPAAAWQTWPAAPLPGHSQPRTPTPRIKPGSTLLREWHGRTYTVLALEEGFEMAGQRFVSLSEVARHITGAHWRCAIYTRKSTEEGLEQEFNSLDAQREACEAYILSQKHEGWTLCRTRYDDGGSPAAPWSARPSSGCWPTSAGRVDVVVVYKVDRLTRSLPTSPRSSTSSMRHGSPSSRSPSSSTPPPAWGG